MKCHILSIVHWSNLNFSLRIDNKNIKKKNILKTQRVYKYFNEKLIGILHNRSLLQKKIFKN